MFCVRSSSCFGLGCLNFLGVVVFIYGIRLSSFLCEISFINQKMDRGRLHFFSVIVFFFLGEVVFIFWVRSSPFFG